MSARRYSGVVAVAFAGVLVVLSARGMAEQAKNAIHVTQFSSQYFELAASHGGKLAQYLAFEPLEKQALLERPCLRTRAASLVELLEMKSLMARVPGGPQVAH